MNNLSEEEKKAIDILINEIADIVVGEYCTHCKICENEDTECYYTKTIDTVYSLIEKQQKEIEELKKDRYLYNAETGEITKVRNNCVSKDKIREIIYPSPDNYIPVEVQMSEMYRKIENLLKESEI